METLEILQNAGLNDREARVYLAALELGESTVLPIANKAGIKRTYTYDILADLGKKGLVSFYEKNGRRRYVAENPKALEQILKNRLIDFTAVLPELAALYKVNKEKPSVRFFEGAEEIKKIYQEIKEAKEMSGFGSFAKITQYYPEFPQFAKSLLKSGMLIRDLIVETPEALEMKPLYQAPKQEMRFLPANILLETDNIIFGDKVAMISYGETIHGLVIQSKAIAETQKALFEELWAQAREV